MRAGRIHISTPAGIATAAMATGVLVGDTLHVVSVSVLVVCAFATSAFACCAFFLRHRNDLSWLYGLLSFTTFAIAGLVRHVMYASSIDVAWPKAEIRLTAVVTEPPRLRAGMATFRVQTLAPPHRKINLWLSDVVPDDVPSLGECISFETRISRPQNRGNPDEFDYVRWLWAQGVSGMCYVSGSTITRYEPTPAEWRGLPFTTRLRVRALLLRQRLQERYKLAGIDGQTLSILSAMTLADRSLLSVDTRDIFAETGASHLLALSGLHLGVLVGWLVWLIGGPLLLSRWRWLFSLCAAMAIWCFAFMAGMPASLLRASLMLTVFLAVVTLDRGSQSLNSLYIAVGIMLFLRPAYLFDVGAQLSVAAIAGIIIVYPFLSRLLFGRWRFVVYRLNRYHLFWPVSLLLLSLSAQVFTLPLVAYYFHRIPLYAPLLNILLIPLTTFLIYGAVVLLLVASVPLVSNAVAWILTLATGFMLSVLQTASSLPGASIRDFWSVKASPQVVVYNNRRCPALHLIASPDRSWILTPHPEAADSGLIYIRNSFWSRRLTAEPVVLRSPSVATKGFCAVMLCAPFAYPSGVAQPKHVDVLWLCDGFSGRITDVAKAYTPRLLVLDTSLTKRRRESIRRDAERAGWHTYDVGESGVLRLRLNLQ